MSNRRHHPLPWILPAAVLVLALPLLAVPPGPRGPGFGAGHGPGFGGDGGPGPMMEKIAEVLELTDAQRAAARVIHDETRATIEPLRERAETLRDELRAALEAEPRDTAAIGAKAAAMHDAMEAMRAAHEARREKFEALLDAEQRTKLEALHAWLEERREDGPGFGRRGGHFGPRHGGR